MKYFGTDDANLESIGITQETTINDVAITADTIYFWQVITVDAADNSSTSELFQFRVN